MALPNSPYSGINRGAAPQTAKPTKGSQLQVSNVRRVIGNNVHSGYSLPFGAGFISTKLFSDGTTTTAVHQYLYKGKQYQVSIPVKTSPRRGGTVTPVKNAPQTVEGF